MIGKLISYGETREQAIARMDIALSEMVVEGVKNQYSFAQRADAGSNFQAGTFSIHYLEEKLAKRPYLQVAVKYKAEVRLCFYFLEITMREIVLLCAEQEAENLSDALLELGVLSVSVEDADENTDQEQPLYGEPGLEPDVFAWRRNRVVALLPEDLEAAELVLHYAIRILSTWEMMTG